jgi:hypothetical protein
MRIPFGEPEFGSAPDFRPQGSVPRGFLGRGQRGQLYSFGIFPAVAFCTLISRRAGVKEPCEAISLHIFPATFESRRTFPHLRE